MSIKERLQRWAFRGLLWALEELLPEEARVALAADILARELPPRCGCDRLECPVYQMHLICAACREWVSAVLDQAARRAALKEAGVTSVVGCEPATDDLRVN